MSGITEHATAPPARQGARLGARLLWAWPLLLLPMFFIEGGGTAGQRRDARLRLERLDPPGGSDGVGHGHRDEAEVGADVDRRVARAEDAAESGSRARLPRWLRVWRRPPASVARRLRYS